MPRPPIHHISSPKAWATYVAPVRLELIEAMRMIAPCSISELATAIDRPADTLYRHLRKLEIAGIVIDAGVRRRGRRDERVFDLAGDDFRPAPRDPSPRSINRLFDAAAQSIAKILSRTSRDATSAELIEFDSARRNALVKFEHAWLTPDEYQQLSRMFIAIKAFMDERKERRAGRLYFTAFAALPVHRRRSARVRAATSEPRAAATSTEAKAAAPKRGEPRGASSAATSRKPSATAGRARSRRAT